MVTSSPKHILFLLITSNYNFQVYVIIKTLNVTYADRKPAAGEDGVRHGQLFEIILFCFLPSAAHQMP